MLFLGIGWHISSVWPWYREGVPSVTSGPWKEIWLFQCLTQMAHVTRGREVSYGKPWHFVFHLYCGILWPVVDMSEWSSWLLKGPCPLIPQVQVTRKYFCAGFRDRLIWRHTFIGWTWTVFLAENGPSEGRLKSLLVPGWYRIPHVLLVFCHSKS